MKRTGAGATGHDEVEVWRVSPSAFPNQQASGSSGAIRRAVLSCTRVFLYLFRQHLPSTSPREPLQAVTCVAASHEYSKWSTATRSKAPSASSIVSHSQSPRSRHVRTQRQAERQADGAHSSALCPASHHCWCMGFDVSTTRQPHDLHHSV